MVDKLVLQILKDPDREIVVLAIGAGNQSSIAYFSETLDLFNIFRISF